MIDIRKLILQQTEMTQNLRDRQLELNLKELIDDHARYLALKKDLESFQASANKLAKSMAGLTEEEKQALVAEALDNKALVSQLKKRCDAARLKYTVLLKQMPNWKSPDVPTGSTEIDNQVIRTYGKRPEFHFPVRDHVEIGESLGLLDFSAGTKVAGSKFYFLKGHAVLLQHAIKNFVMHKCMDAGFKPVITPDIAYNHILDGGRSQ